MQTKSAVPAGKASVSKAKAKKQELRARTLREQQAKAVVDAAKQAPNLLDQFPSFCSFKKHGYNLNIKYQKALQLSAIDFSWAYQLCEQNMHTMYEDVWGWKAPEKQKELKHSDARYLIVYDGEGQQMAHDGEVCRVAYVHFRFEVEDAVPVLYVYEVQIVPGMQRKGLGAFLMTLLKLVAKKNQLEAIMLTVMNANTAAMKMYTKLGYKLDPTSPSQADPVSHMEDPTGYEIMSLSLASRE
ncbi:hypothetical protein WJX79_002434 [Trebouxia sp. C0005]|nr:MAG: N-alpha-acetyltransferase 40-like [Trebouxia sp. A1-2]